MLRETAPSVVGLSVSYFSQLPFAIAFSRVIRAVLPECLLCLGGTEISDEDAEKIRTVGDAVEYIDERNN